MNNLDPSYLRYIYDNILKGEVSADNESSLPNGLIGMFEDAFNDEISVKKRNERVTFFAFWALLKKEVSISFVSEILNLEEAISFEYLQNFASWFNSPQSGKYTLYHERLRIYFLQKLSQKELQKLNETLIDRLQKAIQEQQKDEFEIYALEFLSDHLLVEAFADEAKGKDLLTFSKNVLIWNRQIKVSNQFSWTKNSIQNSILWTSKHDPKESIFCYLDLVELHYKEQNDSENIVSLVANNEIELALKRIKTFGGADQEGLKRKFVLYMLCLMELTLLDSKTQPWRKEALEKILKHFDEQLPINHSILNWNDYFSSYLVFQMACELAEMELDYLLIYKRTDVWDSDWIDKKSQFTDFQIDVLLLTAFEISIDDKKYNTILAISLLLAKNGKMDKFDSTISNVISFTIEIGEYSVKSISLMEISSVFAKLGYKLEEADYFMQEALCCVDNIGLDHIKNITLSSICIEIVKQGKLEKAKLLLKEINDPFHKDLVLSELSITMSRLGKKTESFSYLNDINFEFTKSITLCKISYELFLQGDLVEADLVIQEAISYAKVIIDDFSKCETMIEISNTFYRQGKIDSAESTMNEVLDHVSNININWIKNIALQNISINFANQNKFIKAYECANIIEYSIEDKCLAIRGIADILIQQGDLEKALELIRSLPNKSLIISSLTEVYKVFFKNDKVEKSNYLIKESLLYENHLLDDYFKCMILSDISFILFEKGSIVESELINQKIVSIIKNIDDLSKKSSILSIISNLFYFQGKLDETAYVIKEAINSANNIFDRWERNSKIKAIIFVLAKQGKFEDALSLARDLRYISDIIELQCYISSELFLKNKKVESESVMQDTIKYIYDSRNNNLISIGLSIVSNTFAKQTNFNQANYFLMQALSYTNKIENNRDKSEAFKNLSISQKKQGKLKEANSSIIEALKFSETSDLGITIELVNQEKFHLAESLSLKIHSIKDFQSCWKEIAKTQIEEKGAVVALVTLFHLQNEEVRKYYLKGWSENVTIKDLSEELLLKALPLYKNDPESIEHLLQTHAINELFFGVATKEEIQKFNRTLNIQWAKDIKDQLENTDNQA